MPFTLIEDDTMDLTERIEELLNRNIELQNRLCGILQNCELHLHGITVGIFALANITTKSFPADLEHAMRHAATVRERRRRK